MPASRDDDETLRITTPAGAETQVTPEVLARLAASLRALGGAAELRERAVELCRAAERRFGLRHGDVRETVTGPIVDALHAPGMTLRKELANGLVFEFSYRSKIARDFVLSPDAKPDHVWEPQTTRLLSHLARSARQVVIGGGYIGDHALFVARELKTGGACHAFEPNAESAALMRANAERNRIENLVVRELGLWNTDAERLALVGDDSHAHPVAVGAADPRGSIETVTLDAYARTHGLDEIGLVMLDIEGGEQAALEGAAGLLARPAERAPAVVFEIHRSYVDWSNGLARTDLVKLLLGFGYHVFAIRDFQSNVPMAGCAIELLPLDAVYLEGPPHGFNMLGVKDERMLEAGVFRICRGKSPKLLLYKDPALHHPSEWLERLPLWLGGA